MVQKTPLHSQHLELHASMVDFHGWEMPIHYGSQIEEHHAVRQHVGMFDVSHMTVVDVLGVGGRQFLRHLLTQDIDKLQHVGQGCYSLMCNESGGIVDDLIVYQRSPENYRLVLNSATREKDIAWILKHAEGLSIGILERPELAMIAVQGSGALLLVQECFPEQAAAIHGMKAFDAIEINETFIARTGYTGEDGVEIIAPAGEIQRLWYEFLRLGVKPCGLGARDTLRLEAGLLLYGQDMDDKTTPMEAGLGWTVNFNAENRNFIGKDVLLNQKKHGVTRTLKGLILQDRGVMRTGQQVYLDERPIGHILSGSFSPTMGTSIALASLPPHAEGDVQVEIRGKMFRAKVCKPRFVKRGQIIAD